ncbi:MAG: 30S ribosomal protein S6 [Clostridiales bacterium]|jgi:small subunit ribosomal protein S6|nr:30S ribosomal protein S6 [Clostridiales bacterium]
MKYEIAVILKEMEDEVHAGEFSKITEVIERFGGVVEKVDDWGKRKLAYEIQKQGRGFYSFITFVAPTNAPAEIENRVRIMENVLRYLIVSVEE